MQLSRRQIIAYVAVAAVVVAVGVRYVVAPRVAGPSAASRWCSRRRPPAGDVAAVAGAAGGSPPAASSSAQPSAAARRRRLRVRRRPVARGRAPAAGLSRRRRLALAGGATAKAELAAVNLAAKVVDGQQILVPEKAPAAPRRPRGAGAAPAAAGAVGRGRQRRRRRCPARPSTSTRRPSSELDALQGVGPSTAQKIIDYRTANGPFTSIDDIKNVSGIGDAKFAAMQRLHHGVSAACSAASRHPTCSWPATAAASASRSPSARPSGCWSSPSSRRPRPWRACLGRVSGEGAGPGWLLGVPVPARGGVPRRRAGGGRRPPRRGGAQRPAREHRAHRRAHGGAHRPAGGQGGPGHARRRRPGGRRRVPCRSPRTCASASRTGRACRPGPAGRSSRAWSSPWPACAWRTCRAPRPGAFDYGRYLRRRGEHVTLEGDFCAPAPDRPARRAARAPSTRLRRRPARICGAACTARSPRSCRAWCSATTKASTRPSSTTSGAAGCCTSWPCPGENVVLLCSMWAFAFSLLGIPRLVRTALLVPARRRLRAAHRGVAVHRARRGLRRRRAARGHGLPAHGRLAAVAGAGGLAAHASTPTTCSTSASSCRSAPWPGSSLLARPLTRLFALAAGAAARSRPGSRRPRASPRPRSRCSPSGRRRWSSVPANLVGGFVLGPDHVPRHAVAAGRLRGELGLARRSTWSPGCSSVFCSRWRTGSPRCRGPCSSGAACRCGCCSWSRWRPSSSCSRVLAARAGEGLRAFVCAPARRARLVGRLRGSRGGGAPARARRRRRRRSGRRSRSSTSARARPHCCRCRAGPTVLDRRGSGSAGPRLARARRRAHRPARALARARRSHRRASRTCSAASPSPGRCCRGPREASAALEDLAAGPASGGRRRALVRGAGGAGGRRVGTRASCRPRRPRARAATRGRTTPPWSSSPSSPGSACCCPGDAEGDVLDGARPAARAPWWSCRITAVAAASTRPQLQRLAPRPGGRPVGPEHATGTPRARCWGSSASCRRAVGAHRRARRHRPRRPARAGSRSRPPAGERRAWRREGVACGRCASRARRPALLRAPCGGTRRIAATTKSGGQRQGRAPVARPGRRHGR